MFVFVFVFVFVYVVVKSKDGTPIPYFVIRRDNIQYDGSNPTLLDAYGGFEISRLPGYSAGVGAAWLEAGGIKVIGNIRGGGEYGTSLGLCFYLFYLVFYIFFESDRFFSLAFCVFSLSKKKIVSVPSFFLFILSLSLCIYIYIYISRSEMASSGTQRKSLQML